MLILWVLDQLYFENPGAKDSCFDPSTPVLRLGAVVTEVFHCIGLTPSVPGCLELWRGWSHLMATYPYPGLRRARIRCFLFSGTAWLSSPVQSPLLGSRQFGLAGTSIPLDIQFTCQTLPVCNWIHEFLATDSAASAPVSDTALYWMICWSQGRGLLCMSVFAPAVSSLQHQEQTLRSFEFLSLQYLQFTPGPPSPLPLGMIQGFKGHVFIRSSSTFSSSF